MEACTSRFYVNIYHKVFRKIYIRPTRSLCTKKNDESRLPDVSSSESDAKVNQNSSGDDYKKDKSASEMQHESDRSKDEPQEKEDQTAQAKLLSVLSDFKVSGQSTRNTFKNLARPPQRLGKKKDEVEIQLRKNTRIGYGKDMVSAVKAVASSLGGDVGKTEQELVQTLTAIDHGMQIEESGMESSKLENAKNEPGISEDMVAAVKAVASSVAGDPEQTESELTKKLLSLAAEGSFKPVDMSELVDGMKVDKTKAEEHSWKSRTMQTTSHWKKTELQCDLFNSPALNVFKLENKDTPQESPQLMIWDGLQKKELQSLVRYAPSNPYEEMIQWTEQGKFWTFPINNEADMHEEENVGFHEHVFLDHLLEGFPKKGPVRYFMDLVIVGLSKNPYISVERKAEHVQWYREYFEAKEEILKQYDSAI